VLLAVVPALGQQPWGRAEPGLALPPGRVQQRRGLDSPKAEPQAFQPVGAQAGRALPLAGQPVRQVH